MCEHTDTKFLDMCEHTETKILVICEHTDTKILDIFGQIFTQIVIINRICCTITIYKRLLGKVPK